MQRNDGFRAVKKCLIAVNAVYVSSRTAVGHSYSYRQTPTISTVDPIADSPCPVVIAATDITREWLCRCQFPAMIGPSQDKAMLLFLSTLLLCTSLWVLSSHSRIMHVLCPFLSPQLLPQQEDEEGRKQTSLDSVRQ
ncbi:hypothetical protein B296_00017562 [Ensete ventricosum]|uniref:Uncharacterized protein n=1 Tax=Ensete ventricosum TaxID=4639 RepID=A0A427AJF8_ENSVE|nr:hypothetical protein B296_00017562 [Ensete ventricosum]